MNFGILEFEILSLVYVFDLEVGLWGLEFWSLGKQVCCFGVRISSFCISFGILEFRFWDWNFGVRDFELGVLGMGFGVRNLGIVYLEFGDLGYGFCVRIWSFEFWSLGFLVWGFRYGI